MEVSYRQDDTYTYADVTGAPPQMEFYGEVRTKATGDNDSTEGVTAAMHKTVNANGALTFRAPTDFLYPDEPRSIQLFGPLSEAQVIA